MIKKNNSIEFKAKLMFNIKLIRIVNLLRQGKEACDKIIIEFDCDGNCKNRVEQINKILHGTPRDNVFKLGIKFEIEEWLCDSLGIKYNDNRRPAKALKDYEIRKGSTYTKDKLPSYGNKLNYERLRKNESFQKFLQLIKS